LNRIHSITFIFYWYLEEKKLFFYAYLVQPSLIFPIVHMGNRGGGHVVVGFTTTYAIGAYNRWCCGFDSHSGRGVQHYVIKFVSDLWQVGGFLRILCWPPRYNWNIVESGIKHHKTKQSKWNNNIVWFLIHWCTMYNICWVRKTFFFNRKGTGYRPVDDTDPFVPRPPPYQDYGSLYGTGSPLGPIQWVHFVLTLWEVLYNTLFLFIRSSSI
jgi:hypothetical protein